ncbi:MAG: hypothetical protein U0694_04405 [Anaerolineae bacterium]
MKNTHRDSSDGRFAINEGITLLKCSFQSCVRGLNSGVISFVSVS